MQGLPHSCFIVLLLSITAESTSFPLHCIITFNHWRFSLFPSVFYYYLQSLCDLSHPCCVHYRYNYLQSLKDLPFSCFIVLPSITEGSASSVLYTFSSLAFLKSKYKNIYLPICLCIYQTIYPSISLSIYQSINLSMYQSVQQNISIYLSIYLSNILSIDLSISIFLSIYLCYISFYIICQPMFIPNPLETKDKQADVYWDQEEEEGNKNTLKLIIMLTRAPIGPWEWNPPPPF